MTQRRWGANNAELHRESRLAARESEERGRLDAAVAGPWGIAWCRRVSAACVRATRDGGRRARQDGEGEPEMETNGTKAEKGTGSRAIGTRGRRVLVVMSVPVDSCSVQCLSVSAGYCQLHPAIGKSTRGVVWRNGDGVDCRNKNGRAKWRRRQWVLVQVRGGTAQGARGGIGGGRPLGQGGSGVPRLGLSPSTVGQWDSGTGTVAVACRCRACKKPERNWRSSPAPASPLPPFQRQAAGPVSRPPSVRRVHGCLHQAANAEASRAQTHSHKRNNRTVSVKKPLLSPRVLDLLDWRCLFRRWRFGSVVSFLPRVSSCQTPNLDRQIGPGSARSWDPGAPAKPVWRLWRKRV